MDVYRFQWDLTTQNSDVVFCFHWISVGSNQQTWLIISWAFHQGAASYLASTGIWGDFVDSHTLVPHWWYISVSGTLHQPNMGCHTSGYQVIRHTSEIWDVL